MSQPLLHNKYPEIASVEVGGALRWIGKDCIAFRKATSRPEGKRTVERSRCKRADNFSSDVGG